MLSWGIKLCALPTHGPCYTTTVWVYCVLWVCVCGLVTPSHTPPRYILQYSHSIYHHLYSSFPLQHWCSLDLLNLVSHTRHVLLQSCLTPSHVLEIILQHCYLALECFLVESRGFMLVSHLGFLFYMLLGNLLIPGDIWFHCFKLLLQKHNLPWWGVWGQRWQRFVMGWLTRAWWRDIWGLLLSLRDSWAFRTAALEVFELL